MPPSETPVTEASVDEAAVVVQEAAARDPNFQLVEGGLSLKAYQWVSRDQVVVEPTIVGSVIALGAPRVVRERVLVGPARHYVAFRELAGVAVRRWAIGVGIELSLYGGEEPIFMETNDAETAQRLADALDLLRRARHRETPEEKSPAPPSQRE
jgi:hypothetical protein